MLRLVNVFHFALSFHFVNWSYHTTTLYVLQIFYTYNVMNPIFSVVSLSFFFRYMRWNLACKAARTYKTRSCAIAEGPRDALVSRNSYSSVISRYNLIRGWWMATICNWEGNRRTDIALAACYRRQRCSHSLRAYTNGRQATRFRFSGAWYHYLYTACNFTSNKAIVVIRLCPSPGPVLLVVWVHVAVSILYRLLVSNSELTPHLRCLRHSTYYGKTCHPQNRKCITTYCNVARKSRSQGHS